jgi:hypothetical protein
MAEATLDTLVVLASGVHQAMHHGSCMFLTRVSECFTETIAAVERSAVVAPFRE